MIVGNGLGFDVKINWNKLCNKKLTPIAVIKSEILDEFRNGLYATFSIITPSKAHTMMDIITATNTGRPRSVIQTKTVYDPTMIISPCAKLINFAIP